MSEFVAVTVKILDKEYMVSCPEQDKEALIASASELNSKISELRDNSKTTNAEKLAIITALNVIHESRQSICEKSTLVDELSEGINRIENKIVRRMSRRNDQTRLKL